ncbi:MAG: DUF167 domain-containing protein [Deltaproteobacteria bacterium]|nr:DUF167 domain-containing protein [Deltaproteobacteria bacterium]
MLQISTTTKGIIFSILVLPRSPRNEVAGAVDGALKLRIAAPPTEGKANAECMRYLSQLLRVPKAQVALIGGHKSRKKTVCITGVKAEAIEALAPSE